MTGDILSHLSDVIALADKRGEPRYTYYLDPPTGARFSQMAGAAGLCVSSFGGFADAQRRIYCASPWEEEDLAWPLTCLCITWDARFYDVGHGDLLGAVMGLGLARERFGDIVIEKPGTAYLFALEASARVIESSLTQAGRATLSVTPCDLPDITPEEGLTLERSLPSPRLDCALSAALNISRGVASELISAGRVQKNYELCLQGDKKVATGDVLSIRGKGRVIVGDFLGKSKKDRQFIRFTVFLHKH